MKKIIVMVLVFLLSFSLASAISVNTVELADLGFTGFVVEANLDTSGSAQVLYGKTGALGSASGLASSSNEHLLQVDGLDSGTVYFYRVVGKDNNGNSYSSAISLTRTPTNTNFGVSGFYLNSDTSGDKIRDISDGEILDISTLPANAHIAVATFGSTESVVFYLNGVYHNTENGFPWTFFGGFDDLPAGTHTITVKSYAQDGIVGQETKNGNEGVSKSITFTIKGAFGSQTTPSPQPSPNPAQTAKVTPPPTPTITPATLASYGALGNGVKDDTVAIQNALNSEKYIVAEPGKTYLISKALIMNRNLRQYVDFKGSTLTTKGHNSFMIDIDKRRYSNSLTTIKNLNIDGNNKNVHGIDVASRVYLENIDIYDMVREGSNGVRVLVSDDPGIYGRTVFDNVDIHNLRPVANDGQTGNSPGYVHGFLVSTKELVTQPVQIVYINSDLYEFWGEDAGAITINSPGIDTSNSPLSFWFENIRVWDAQRRAVKNFIGGATWINSRFTSPDNDNPNLVPKSKGGANPAGLFVVSAGSSARGSTNNYICGSVFEGPPSDPNDGWFTNVIVSGYHGPAGVEIRNSIFTGGHGGRWGWNGLGIGGYVDDILIANTKFDTGKILRSYTAVKSQGTVVLDTNNIYIDGKSAVLNSPGAPFNLMYTEKNLPYEPCPTIK